MRVALFSTGDEIVEPGAPLPAAALYDANRYLLAGLLDAARRRGHRSRHSAPTSRDARRARSPTAAHGHDLVLTSGGVSTGEADHVRDAVEAIGRLVFWRVAIKPGRPVAMGVIRCRGDGAAFVGLPGNPVAVFVTFARVVRPLLLRLAGALPRAADRAAGARGFAYRKRKDRREYVRVSLRDATDGAIEAREASAGRRRRVSPR